jgi:hypothetical protein
VLHNSVTNSRVTKSFKKNKNDDDAYLVFTFILGAAILLIFSLAKSKANFSADSAVL